MAEYEKLRRKLRVKLNPIVKQAYKICSQYTSHDPKLASKAAKRRYYHTKVKQNRATYLWGIDYKTMLDNQCNKCAICGRSPDKQRLSVDHSHKTKYIRGLLCNQCNTGLGMFKENIDSLKAAIKYIEDGERREQQYTVTNTDKL